MKIDFSVVDKSQFDIQPRIVNGEVCYLIQPQYIGAKWNQENKIFRSSLWDSEGNLISAGFPKFTNWGENPEHFPTPDSLKNCVCVEKLDGSLLVVSKWKGNYILRTRGTVDASEMDNGHELEIFRTTILSKLLNICDTDTWDRSFLFEWLSPENRIVVRVEEPQFKLVGCVIHDDYALYSQDALDYWSNQYSLLRPDTYSFDSVSDLLELVKNWEGREGIVVYSKGGQVLHKIKSDWYLFRHRLKEEFGNLEKIVDFFIQEKCPSYEQFVEKITTVTDWETAQEIRGDISRICDAWKQVKQIIEGMENFIRNSLLVIGDPKNRSDRSKIAKKVIESYGITNRSSYVFSLMDGRELDSDSLKRLLYQCLKK